MHPPGPHAAACAPDWLLAGPGHNTHRRAAIDHRLDVDAAQMREQRPDQLKIITTQAPMINYGSRSTQQQDHGKRARSLALPVGGQEFSPLV
jgi:hypothetical protein